MRISTAVLSLFLAATGSMTPALAAGLPQLDPSKFAPQIIWLVITFVVLYVLMARIALPRVGQVLEKRQNRIEGDLKKAEELKAQAQATAEAYDKAIAKARANAQDVLKEIRDQLTAEAAAQHDDLSGRLGEETAAAEKRIAKSKNEALSEIRDLAVEVAQSATKRLVGEASDAKALKSAITATLKERKS